MVPVHCIFRSQELKIDFLTKNLKNLLVRNHWTDFNIILQKCSFGHPLPRLFKPFGFVKNMAARRRGLFSLYIYIENFKNLLVRNHWTDFHIILQKCSFGDPLPRLFKPFGFVKKHGCQGAGLISSPEHEVLMVSCCGQSMSIVRHVASTIALKAYFSYTPGPIDSILGRKHWDDL